MNPERKEDNTTHHHRLVKDITFHSTVDNTFLKKE